MSARDSSVIYEVRLEVDPSIAAEIDAWLPDHVAEMLSIRGFQSAQILADDPLPDPKDGKVRRTVHYHLSGLDALGTYLTEHAARMREAGRARFGERMRATRRVLAPMDAAVTGSVRACSNCHLPLSGQYCGNCGQRDRSRMISLWELVRDLAGEVFDLDSRLWRTLIPLLFRPGRLTREYLLGRRVAFTPPLRLYLATSLLFFLIATFGGVDDAVFQFDGDDEAVVTITGDEATTSGDGGEASAPAEATKPPTDAAAPDAPAPEDPPADAKDAAPDEQAQGWLIEENGHCTIGNFETGSPFLDGPVRERLKTACDRIVSDHGKSFVRQLIDNIPLMLVFVLPVLAFVMKPLYFGSRRYYVEHLLFFVHCHSFVFLALTMTLLTSRLSDAYPQWRVATGIMIAVVSIYIPYYLFRALRIVYGQGRFVTLIKYGVLFFTYLFGLTIIFTVGALVTALTV